MLLPDPQRRGDIHFVLARSLPYRKRLGLMLALLAAGFLLQVLGCQFQAGLAVVVGAGLLLAASLLGIVKGYTNIPEALPPSRWEWRAGDRKGLEKILEIARKSKDWDQSLIDVSCAPGCLTFGFVAMAVGVGAFLLLSTGQRAAAGILVVDAAILLAPYWITGVRDILTNAPLTVKVENLLAVYAGWEAAPDASETMSVQLQMSEHGEGGVPLDAKLILQLPALGPDFYGVQTQVVLNNVQGRDYPYLYCVLVAKPELEMPARLRSVTADAANDAESRNRTRGWFSPAPDAICAEWSRKDGLDILVIRQATTKTSGYHTKPEMIQCLFQFARRQAHRLQPPPAAIPPRLA